MNMSNMTIESKIAMVEELRKFFGHDKVYSFYRKHIECDSKFEKAAKQICKKHGAEIQNEYKRYNAAISDEKMVLSCFDIVNY